MDWKKDVDLTSQNSLGFKASAENYASVHSIEELALALEDVERREWPLLVLGGGSNLVLREQIPGAVISIASTGIQVLADDEDKAIVEVGAGENWHGFVGRLLEMGLHGLENLALIPGSVGAAPVQNIGAYGVELADCFHSLTAYDREARALVQLNRSDCCFGYRDSIFKSSKKGRYVIWRVRFILSSAFEARLQYRALSDCLSMQDSKIPTAHQVYQAVCDIRRSKLPIPSELGNVGSFFENPIVPESKYHALMEEFPNIVGHAERSGFYKLAAGWLIDQAGWKGHREGPVGVYDKQALVLVNHGEGSIDQLLDLAGLIVDSVRSQFGVQLKMEPQIYPA